MREDSLHSAGRLALLVLFVLLVLNPSTAQPRFAPSHTLLLNCVSVDFTPDTVIIQSGVEFRPLQHRKSTTLAVVLSVVLPGAGQVYTERYWKIPVIWGFGAFFARQWSRANELYLDARSRFQSSVQAGENAGRGNAQAKYERDFYRDERDRFGFYIALTYLLNIVDAYVGASLYDFDVSDDLGGTARLTLRVPVR